MLIAARVVRRRQPPFLLVLFSDVSLGQSQTDKMAATALLFSADQSEQEINSKDDNRLFCVV